MAQALKKIAPLLNNEKINLAIAILAAFIGAAASLLDPIIIGRAVDLYIKNGDYRGVLISAAILLGVYVIGLVATYIQTLALGGVGRRVLFGLRNELFCKLQELPVAFFNQNKSGDLISRINNDTDKLNQFISHALMQFMRSSFTVAAPANFLVVVKPPSGRGGPDPGGSGADHHPIAGFLGGARQFEKFAINRADELRDSGEFGELQSGRGIQPS